jgi:hypothetical protein
MFSHVVCVLVREQVAGTSGWNSLIDSMTLEPVNASVWNAGSGMTHIERLRASPTTGPARYAPEVFAYRKKDRNGTTHSLMNAEFSVESQNM